MNNNQNPNNDAVVRDSPQETVSAIQFSPNGQFLAGSSWSKQVRVWEVRGGDTMAKAEMSHEAPVLDVSWMGDGSRVFSGGCDNMAKMWDLQANQNQQVAQHDAPIKSLYWVDDANLLATGSWDKTVKFWDARSPNAKHQLQLPERVYAMDCTWPLLTVATAERHVLIFDLRNPGQPFRTTQSPLKYQSRCVANFPDNRGFALGSIEGRVAISHVHEQDVQSNFAFKCHRHNDEVYAVNSISFNRAWGTFATCGSDGVYVFWDKDAKQRLKLFQRNASPITASCFNREGNVFAYALGYDWSKGVEFYDPKKPNQIMLHAVQRDEIAPRKK